MKRYRVTLEEDERQELEQNTRKGSHQSQKVINALVLLNCDEGASNLHRPTGEEVAEILRMSQRKIDRVKRRFVEEGLVALSCSAPPKGRSQWSLRLLADRAVELEYIDSISYEPVRWVLKNEIKPWRQIGWVIPPQGNVEFVAVMERVPDVYFRPYDPARPVVCMDETPRASSSGRSRFQSRRDPDNASVTTTSTSAAACAMSSWLPSR